MALSDIDEGEAAEPSDTEVVESDLGWRMFDIQQKTEKVFVPFVRNRSLRSPPPEDERRAQTPLFLRNPLIQLERAACSSFGSNSTAPSLATADSMLSNKSSTADTVATSTSSSPDVPKVLKDQANHHPTEHVPCAANLNMIPAVANPAQASAFSHEGAKKEHRVITDHPASLHDAPHAAGALAEWDRPDNRARRIEERQKLQKRITDDKPTSQQSGDSPQPRKRRMLARGCGCTPQQCPDKRGCPARELLSQNNKLEQMELEGEYLVEIDDVLTCFFFRAKIIWGKPSDNQLSETSSKSSSEDDLGGLLSDRVEKPNQDHLAGSRQQITSSRPVSGTNPASTVVVDTTSSLSADGMQPSGSASVAPQETVEPTPNISALAAEFASVFPQEWSEDGMASAKKIYAILTQLGVAKARRCARIGNLGIERCDRYAGLRLFESNNLIIAINPFDYDEHLHTRCQRLAAARIYHAMNAKVLPRQQSREFTPGDGVSGGRDSANPLRLRAMPSDCFVVATITLLSIQMSVVLPPRPHNLPRTFTLCELTPDNDDRTADFAKALKRAVDWDAAPDKNAFGVDQGLDGLKTHVYALDWSKEAWHLVEDRAKQRLHASCD